MANMQMAIANIERIDIITGDSPPRVLSFDSASDASAQAQISAGSEKELRIKNQIVAQNFSEDIVKGFNISFTDSTFSPEVFALVDGGQSYVSDSGAYTCYSAPAAGQVVSRTKCTLVIYSSEKDYDGHSLSFTAFAFPNASGSPASVSLRDGEFFAPSYTLKSRPSKGSSPMTVFSLPSMPVIVGSAADLPPSPVAGKTVILAAASGIAGLASNISAGTYALYTSSGYAAI